MQVLFNQCVHKQTKKALIMTVEALLHKKSAWLLHEIGDKAPPATYDSSDVARALNQRCCPHNGDGGHSWGLSSYCCRL